MVPCQWIWTNLNQKMRVRWTFFQRLKNKILLTACVLPKNFGRKGQAKKKKPGKNLFLFEKFISLIDSDYFGNLKTNVEDTAMISRLLFHNLMAFECNYFTLSQSEISKNKKYEELPEQGMAVFCGSSMFNHSCNPNVTHYYAKIMCNFWVTTLWELPFDMWQDLTSNASISNRNAKSPQY